MTLSSARYDQQLLAGTGSGSPSVLECPAQDSLTLRRAGGGFKKPPPLLLSELPEVQEEGFGGASSAALGSHRRHDSGFTTPALLQLVPDAATQAAASTAAAAAPSPGAASLCSPAQRCLFGGHNPSRSLQPGSSSSSCSTVHGVTPGAVDRVAVDRWLHTMEARLAAASPASEVAGDAELPPPAFVVLQLLG